MKSRFITRLFALIIDLIIVSLLVNAITMFIPTNKNAIKISEETYQLMDEFVDGKISEEEYTDKVSAYSYQLAKYSTGTTIIQTAIFISYFVVYQYKKNGQTLGKRILKLRVVSAKQDKSDLTMNDYVFRSFIINGIIFLLIDIFCILLLPEALYIMTSGIFEIVEICMLIITMFMVLYRADGRGIHDFIGQTKVISEK